MLFLVVAVQERTKESKKNDQVVLSEKNDSQSVKNGYYMDNFQTRLKCMYFQWSRGVGGRPWNKEKKEFVLF